MKITELKAEHLFMEKKRAAEYEAESISIQEQVAKAEAHAKVLEDLDEKYKVKTDGSKESSSRIRKCST